MSAARWPHLKELLDEALRRSGSERAAFLEAACGADTELRRELESLAAASDDAGAFLEAPIALTASGTARLITSFDSGAPPAALSRASDRFPPGALINGRYRTECLVGAGGMGSVYRVSDTVLSRTLALKTMRGREHVLNLFKIEFRTLAQLGHPHLAQSYDFEPIAGSTDYFFTMEFVDGCNLFDATEGVGWPGIVDLLVQLCRVLAYVHNRGIVHRDIKPTNVLVRADGVLKLVDFGLVGMPDGADHLIGTPAYVAPELMNQGAGDYRSDLYSLGVLAYQLLCRRLPFAGLALPDLVYQQAHSLPRFPDDAEAPVWLRNVILRLCATLPSDRFRNANQVIEAINTDGGLQYPIETAVTRESYVLSGRFVGRQHELATLSAWSGQRLDGGVSADGPFMLVGGPSGVGKSRLIRELRHAVQLDRQTFVEANCFEGAAAEYGAFAEAVAQLVPLAESRGGAALVDRDWHALVKIAPELDLHRAVPPAVPLLTQEAERRRLLDTVAGFLVEVSDRCPYVLYLNDLQWAPQGTTDILRHLHRRIAIDERRGHRVRMGMLGSYRDDEIEGRPVEGLFEEIRATATFLRLNPLAAPPMRQLIQSMFGLDDIPESFVGRVLEEAAGSPFFLEEIVRVLVENGSVFVEGGVWQTTTAVGALEIPASIAATLLRRLAMLFNADQHALLRVLAAYKKPMSMSVLATAAGIGADRTQEALRALTIRHMVAPMDGGSAYRTAHDGLRTIVYDDLGSAAPAVHGRIAHALESANVRPPLSELAHHYWLASDSERALTYAQLAGEAALAVYANDEAIEHLEHALTLLASGSVEARVRVMEQLADAHFLAGHYDRTKALLLEVSQSVTAALDRARIQRKLGEVIGYSEGKPGLAVDVLWTAARQLGARRPRTPAAYLAHTIGALVMHLVQRLARHLPAATDDLQRARRTELASIYLRIGYLSFFGDPRLLFLPVFRAANVSHQLGESREHSQVHAMVAVACAGLRQRARAIRYGEEAIAEAERTRSPWHVANARNLHGVVLIESGHWRQALAYAEQAREGFTACGDHFQLAISLYTILEVLHGCGDLQVAIARGREELMVYERLGLQMIGKGVYTVFGQLLAKAGDADGITVGREVLARAEHGSDKLSTAWAHIALGDALLQFDHVDEAIDQLERGLAIRDKHRFDMYVVAPGSALLARAYSTKLRSGSPASPAVVRAFERQVARAQAAGKRFPPMRSLALLARGLLWRSRGQPMVAADDFTRAATAAERLGARLWQADAYLERGLALFEARGRSSADAERALERAAELFRACCATAGERRTTHAQREIALTGQTRIMPRN